MKDALWCSFCGKPQGAIAKLVLARKGRSRAAICNECLAVCRKILVKSGTAPITDPSESSQKLSSQISPRNELNTSANLSSEFAPKTYYKIAPQPTEPRQLICSFCGAPQHKAHRLIGSRPGLRPTYICGECVARGDVARGARHKPSIVDWIARKLGRHDTGIHHIG